MSAIGTRPAGGAGASGSAPAREKRPKNVPGSRQDVAWKHGFVVESNKVKIKCKYCDTELWGGAYRLKHHLAGTSKDVSKCIAVPDNDKEEMRSIVIGLQTNLIKKKRRFDADGTSTCADGENDPKRQEFGSGSGTGQQNIFNRKMAQRTVPGCYNKDRREDAAQSISRFFL